jgi:hypothetical protein
VPHRGPNDRAPEPKAGLPPWEAVRLFCFQNKRLKKDPDKISIHYGSKQLNTEKVWHRTPTTIFNSVFEISLKRYTQFAATFLQAGKVSLLRLVTAVLMEISEDWETGKVYLNPQEERPIP